MRTFLVLLVLACLLPGAVGVTLLFVHEYRDVRADLEKNTLRTARALVQAVDSHLLRVESVAQTLAKSDALARRDFATFHRTAREVVALAGLGTNVVLRDEAGRQVLNTAVALRPPPMAPPAPAAVRELFATGAPTVSEIFTGPVLNRAIVSVDVPVFLGGRVAYALGVGVAPEHFERLLQAQDLPQGWIASVLDAGGRHVARSVSAAEFVGRKPPDRLLEAIGTAHEGAVELTTFEGVEALSSYSRSPYSNWSVAIAIPRDAYQGDLVRTLAMLAAGVIALFGASLLLARFVGETIARSVEALTAPAGALGRGEPPRLPRVAIREAAEVAAEIGRAADLLAARDAALRARDAELAEAHRLAKFGTWYWNFETDEVVSSASLREIYGRATLPSFPDLRGTLLPRESWERIDAASREAKLTGQGYDVEVQVNHGAGYPIWVHAKCEAVRDGNGRVVALRGTVQDITERKRAEDALRETKDRLRLLADNIAQHAWIANGSGWVIWFNRRWFDYTGTTLDAMHGWGWRAVLHPEHVGRVITSFRRCVDAGEPWQETLPLRGADGTYRWFYAQAIPERDEFGRVRRWFGTNTDVTEQREIEEELRKFKFFSNHANDQHLLLDAAGRVRYANRLACECLGYDEAELLSLTVPDLDPLYPAERFQEILARSRHARIPPFESVHRRKDGTTLPVEIAVTVLEFRGEWLMFAVSRDITERKDAEQRVRDAALHDTLTGLPNRALVFEYCGHLLAAARRGHGRGALLFIDLDRFKPINDLYGHEIGDRVLKQVAERLLGCTRHEDLVGRLGGDEFVVVLPYVEAERHRAAVVAQNVVACIAQPFRLDGLELSITPSVGISYFPEHASDVSGLIHAADLAMYQAKQTGRAHFRFYTPELEQRAGEALAIELRLRRALGRGGLALHYQPVIDLKTGALVGAEALLRLADDGVPVEPAVFIPIAESSGLITELGEWVAAEACRQQDAWRRCGLKLTVAINVSPLQFRQAAFAERLSGIVAEAGADPACLVVEVTESAVMESVDDAVRVLARIKSLGVKVALDDFGTGYSSLSSLSSLPLDKLKVDQSFVRRIERDQASRAVIQAIIALGRSLRLEVVAEGIESEKARRYLADHGCHQAQGFWFSKPLPADAFAQWCRELHELPVAAE